MIRTARYLSALCLLASSAAASAYTVTLTPGSLSESMKEIAASGDSSLKLEGNADIRDLLRLQSLPPAVTDLDMSGLRIVEYSSNRPYYDGRSLFRADELPTNLFFGSGLRSVSLPDNIKELPEGLFAGSEVEAVAIPSTVVRISPRAFYSCTRLGTVSFPTSLSYIGEEAFAGCTSLTRVDLAATSVRELGRRAFFGDSSLADVTLSPALTGIGEEAFSGAGVRSLDASMATRLDSFSLSGMKDAESVRVNSDASYGDGVLMANGSLKEASGIPSDLPALLLAQSPLTDIGPEVSAANVIGEYALAANNMDKITLSSDLGRVARGAFYAMPRLVSIDATALRGSLPEADDESFRGINQSAITLYVSEGYEAMWSLHPAWGRFKIAKVGVEAPVADESEIRVAASDGTVTVKASEIIERAEVFGKGGELLAMSTPADTECRLDMAGDCDIIVVRVTTPSATKAFKIMMR